MLAAVGVTAPVRDQTSSTFDPAAGQVEKIQSLEQAAPAQEAAAGKSRVEGGEDADF